MEKAKMRFGNWSIKEILLDYALYIILVLILLTVVIIRPDFFRVDNIINIVKQASTKGAKGHHRPMAAHQAGCAASR